MDYLKNKHLALISLIATAFAAGVTPLSVETASAATRSQAPQQNNRFDARQCIGKNVRVGVSSDEKFLTIITPKQRKTYGVTQIDSVTGDVDFTYVTREGIELTIDDEHGDFITFKNRHVPLKCRWAPN